MGKAKLRLFIYNHAPSYQCVDDVNTFKEIFFLCAIFIIWGNELLLTYIKGVKMGIMYKRYYIRLYGILCTYIKNDTNLFSVMDFVFLLHVGAMEMNLE